MPYNTPIMAVNHLPSSSQSGRCVFSHSLSLTPPAIGFDKPYHLMHCKQISYDNDLAVGKHVVMVHTIQTHDIQTQLNIFYPMHFPKTKTKLEEFEVSKSMSEGHMSTHHRQCTSKHV